MTGIDKATGRAIALIVLLVLAAAALRGYLPGTERASSENSTGSPASLVIVVVLIGLSMAILAFAIIMRLRDRRAKPRPAESQQQRLGGTAGRPTWRFWLITAGLVAAWLLFVSLMPPIGRQPVADQMPPGPQQRTTEQTNNNAPPPREPTETNANLFAYLAGVTVIFLLLTGTATVIASRRRGAVTQPGRADRDRSVVAVTPAGAESLARAAELGLAEIGDLSREPREAIIACYAAMERELANVPEAIPQDFDTPTEVLARAVDHHALRGDNATQLVELFEEARFSPHVMNEGHREVAVRVLRLVLAELRSAV